MHPELQQLYREHFGQLVASVNRVCNDLGQAEDAVQDAFLKAVDAWQYNVIPDHAVAWLMKTARNKVIDGMRRGQSWQAKVDDVAYLNEIERAETAAPELESGSALNDDMLRLIFTCCHPALHMDARVALCLSIVCGLKTEEIAKAFIVTNTSMSQRLWRAKSKIRDAGIAYRVPAADEIDERLSAVLAVIYLIFNEGWLASAGGSGLRMNLIDEAIRLARLLCITVPAAAEVQGLLALLLIQNSRRDTRFDNNGQLVRLSEQDRSLWHRNEIREGTSMLMQLFKAGHGMSRYAIMAAIASVHANAPSAQATDWQEIETLYGHLQELDPSPVIALNRAVAIGERDGPAAGLLHTEQLAESTTMQRYYLYHSTRAEFLRRLGRTAQAREAFGKAMELCVSSVEKDFLRRQRDAPGASG